MDQHPTYGFDRERYSRQMLVHGIGEEGQRRIRASKVVVIGCGALGCMIINFLARGGIGRLVIVDRDFVEISNLQRQLLFEESDAEAALPKAVAAARAVRRINSEVEVEPVIADVLPVNVEQIVAGADVVLDGTDNLETRHLINDACVKAGIPWVYGGALASTGMSMTIVPGETACLRCVFPAAMPAGTVATCETVGVLASVVASVAAVQSTEALKLIVGERQHINRGLICIDLWAHDYTHLPKTERDPHCPCCGQGKYEFLEARAVSRATSLCGRHAVQVSPSASRNLDLKELGKQLAAAGTVLANDYLVRLTVGDYELTIFPDGRAIVKGTDDETVARSLYARYVGT